MTTTSTQARKSATKVQGSKSATSAFETKSSTSVASSVGSPYPQVAVRITQDLNTRITQSGDRRIRS